jgi:peptidoglycan/LPS O-acetylase OafA/YrhL
VHRPRGEAALSQQDRPLPQAWVPRVVNLALAACLLAFLVPLATHLPGRPVTVQVVLVVVAVPFAVLALACLASAARPGSLGRLARRARRTR